MARQKKKPPEDNELRWLTTYGDVVTLLMAFFVMLYAISQVDVQKFQLFVSGLEDPFDNSAATQGILSEGSGIVGQSAGTERIGQNQLYGIGVLDDLPDTIDPDPDSTNPGGVRPEALTLANGAADSENVVETVVTNEEFEGQFLKIYLKGEGPKDIGLSVTNDGSISPPEIGAETRIVFDANRAVVLPSGAMADE